MHKRTADEIIDHIVQVTGHADRDMLQTSLVSTLYELLNIHSISLSHIIYHYGEPELHLTMEINPTSVTIEGMLSTLGDTPLSSLPDFERSLKTANSVEVDHHHNRHYIYPLFNGKDEVIGFIELFGEAMGDSDRRLLEGVLKIYRNYIRILDESERDTLTGLLNRRTFDKNIHQLLQESNSDNDTPDDSDIRKPKRRVHGSDKKNWLAVIDIDHFKTINDRYGHLYGDEVLLLLANIMRTSFRGYDKLFRFGGEEFVIVLKFLSEEDATQTLERFRKTVEEHKFPQVNQVTVSIGFIEMKSDDIPSRILGMADDALYYAKDHGRNQICFYKELLASGELHEANISDDIELF
jgi:diguanylate cyclase (GGDEF)-like protein